MKTIIYFIFIFVAIVSCKKSIEPQPLPKANFTWTTLENGTIQFENKSVDASIYEWNFGDNTNISNDPNPKHKFKANSIYEVALTVSNKNGLDKKISKIEVKNILPIAVLKFSIDKLNVPCVLSVNGNNPKESSNIRVFSENKNEIINSSSQNISQKILNSGFYTIEYTVANLGGTSTKIDSFIVFENSAINDFWEVKLKELPVKIRKANAEKVDNQATLLFIYEKISRMKSQIPNWVFDYFKKTTLWIDDINKPNSAAAYHPSSEWLIQNGFMKEKAKGVELFNLYNYVDWTKRAQPEMLLHEYAHAYHDQIMQNGFNNKWIIDSYNTSISTKKYELVDYILGGKVKHYAMTNQMEYFAEMTEAYFGKNDMYPYTKNDLKLFDIGAYELMEKVWVTGLKNK